MIPFIPYYVQVTRKVSKYLKLVIWFIILKSIYIQLYLFVRVYTYTSQVCSNNQSSYVWQESVYVTMTLS